MVGGEKHPPPDAIYYLLSNGRDFQGQFGSASPQEAITYSFLPLTSQGTALDIRGVRIQNSQLRWPHLSQREMRIKKRRALPILTYWRRKYSGLRG